LVPRRPERGTWEQVVSLADSAAYLAKRSGRNAWVGLSAEGVNVPEWGGLDSDAIRSAVEAGTLRLTSSLDAAGRAIVWTPAA